MGGMRNLRAYGEGEVSGANHTKVVQVTHQTPTKNNCICHIYLLKKVVHFVVALRSPKLHYIILGTIEKPSMSRGARGVFIMFRPTMQDSLKSNNCGK
jgi:hypothetical protein